MMAAGMGNVGGGKGPRPVTQLDGLEAARQQNLEKIQHLQQTLEAAHQQVFFLCYSHRLIGSST